MYKHVLIATDGSELADKATTEGIALAKAVGAKVTAVYVRPAIENLIVEGVIVQIPPEQRKEMAARIDALLAKVTNRCKAAGVTTDQLSIQNNLPWRGIIDAADAKGADLIVMASHGRRGMSKLLLGSETQQVLTHSKLPVLVVH